MLKCAGKKMIRGLLACCSLLAVVACTDEEISSNGFFPLSEEGGKNSIPRIRGEWYSSQLTSLKEEPLYAKRKEKNLEVYRFTFLPAWGSSKATTIFRDGGELRVRSRRLDGEDGFEPGELVEEFERELRGSESESLFRLLEEVDFTDDATEKKGAMGEDGTQWILEGVHDGQYHVLDRWSPDSRMDKETTLAPLVELCDWMSKLDPE